MKLKTYFQNVDSENNARKKKTCKNKDSEGSDVLQAAGAENILQLLKYITAMGLLKQHLLMNNMKCCY
jgi:hypothetical protein